MVKVDWQPFGNRLTRFSTRFSPQEAQHSIFLLARPVLHKKGHGGMTLARRAVSALINPLARTPRVNATVLLYRRRMGEDRTVSTGATPTQAVFVERQLHATGQLQDASWGEGGHFWRLIRHGCQPVIDRRHFAAGGS